VIGTVSSLAIVGVLSLCEITVGCWTPNEATEHVFRQTKDVGQGKVTTASATRTIGDAASRNASLGVNAMNAIKAESDAPRTVQMATTQNFEELVLQSDEPVLVDFYADWCGPCQMISPVLKQLAHETTDAKVVKVNVDQSPQLASAYGVSSIPMLLVFNEGRVVKQHVGLTDLGSLKRMIQP
jgi:thioredoxin 1